MSFLVKILNQLFEKAAVDTLASSTVMKAFASKVVELERAMDKPEETKAAAKEQVQSFFQHFSAEVAKDLGLSNQDEKAAGGRKMLETKSADQKLK